MMPYTFGCGVPYSWSGSFGPGLALPIAVIMMFIAYHWALQAANTYGKLLETAFDLYRPLLYQALRFPLPAEPATEIEAGKNLTAYLLRGTKSGVRFEKKS